MGLRSTALRKYFLSDTKGGLMPREIIFRKMKLNFFILLWRSKLAELIQFIVSLKTRLHPNVIYKVHLRLVDMPQKLSAGAHRLSACLSDSIHVQYVSLGSPVFAYSIISEVLRATTHKRARHTTRPFRLSLNSYIISFSDSVMVYTQFIHAFG